MAFTGFEPVSEMTPGQARFIEFQRAETAEAEIKRLQEKLADTETEKIERGTEILSLRADPRRARGRQAMTGQGCTIYLSGPISLGGSLQPNETQAFVDAFAAHAAALRDRGAKVINPCECEPQESWEAYMRLGIASVCVSDYVAVLPRWLESRGALLEVFVARQLGIPVVAVEELALAVLGEADDD